MMPHKNKIITTRSMKNKQKGATLFTALVFLTLMALVSVSSVKISMLDVLISGNNQQQMVIFQKTARELDEHAKPAKLIKLIQKDHGDSNNYREEWHYDFPVDTNNPHSKEKITNRVLEYGCGAIDGLATSQGSENSCRLFDFEVRNQKSYSGAKDRHLRGAGKEFPSASRNNFNNN